MFLVTAEVLPAFAFACKSSFSPRIMPLHFDNQVAGSKLVLSGCVFSRLQHPWKTLLTMLLLRELGKRCHFY